MLRLASGVLAFMTLVVTSLPAAAQTQETVALADPAGPGPYAVGATSRNFQRTGITGQRNLVTFIWYPAVAGGGAIDPRVEAVTDATPNTSGGPYPVVVWSHGNTGAPQNYSYYLSHLANWGFVVVAPLHR